MRVQAVMGWGASIATQAAGSSVGSYLPKASLQAAQQVLQICLVPEMCAKHQVWPNCS